MKPILFKTLPAAALGCALLFSSARSVLADADDAKADAGASIVKHNADGESVVTLDDATQKRIKLEFASPAAKEWLPQVKAYGRVLDPSPLIAEVADLATARISAEGSEKEYARLKTLAAQDNAPARALEAAQLANTHDRLTLESLRTKLAADWGPALAERKDLADFVRSLADRKSSLVRLVVPSGDNLTDPPVATDLSVFPDEHLIPADLIEFNLGVDPQTQGQVLLYLVKDRALPWGAAVTGQLSLTGKSLTGVEIPADAVIRHDGAAWIYLRTGDTEFTRHEIPVNRMTPNGWFVTGDLSTTNVFITGGAETVMSAEMGGGFNTGTRD